MCQSCFVGSTLNSARADLQRNALEAEIAVEEIISYPAFAIAVSAWTNSPTLTA
jgi:hypothetical protein